MTETRTAEPQKTEPRMIVFKMTEPRTTEPQMTD